MIVTEEEAKTKRCQESFGGSPVMCIGSACMAWQWAKKYWTDRLTARVRSQDPDSPSGYCGKAGEP